MSHRSMMAEKDYFCGTHKKMSHLPFGVDLKDLFIHNQSALFKSLKGFTAMITKYYQIARNYSVTMTTVFNMSQFIFGTFSDKCF